MSNIPTQRRLWLAATAATGVVVVSVWATLIPLAFSAEGAGAGGVALGLALIPLAFVVASAGSGQPDWPLATLKAMGLSVIVGFPLGVFVDPLSGLVAAYAMGAVVSIRRPNEGSPRRRWWAALTVIILIVVMVRISLPVAVTIGPALPFMAPLLADRD